jgi:hypothetical protein
MVIPMAPSNDHERQMVLGLARSRHRLDKGCVLCIPRTVMNDFSPCPQLDHPLLDSTPSPSNAPPGYPGVQCFNLRPPGGLCEAEGRPQR